MFYFYLYTYILYIIDCMILQSMSSVLILLYLQYSHTQLLIYTQYKDDRSYQANKVIELF